MKNYNHSEEIRSELKSLICEIDSLRTDILANKTTDKNSESVFHHPTWLAILGLIGTLITGIGTGVWQLHASRELEREKLRSTLIQEASKSGNPEITLRNLQFLVKYKLIKDEDGLFSELRVENVPSFTTEARKTKPHTQDEMVSLFGDPKLSGNLNEGQLGGLAKPDESWVLENLVMVDLPLLIGVEGFPASGKIKFHKKAAPHLQAAFKEISQLGLLSHIKSFDGAWVPRTIPTVSKYYSSHAFGIAFDINAKFNRYGTKPPDAGEEGSVSELVPIFEKHGFFWGGYFKKTDGKHFQYGIQSANIKIEK